MNKQEPPERWRDKNLFFFNLLTYRTDVHLTVIMYYTYFFKFTHNKRANLKIFKDSCKTEYSYGLLFTVTDPYRSDWSISFAQLNNSLYNEYYFT